MGIEANFLGEISSELLCPICSFVFDKPATNCKEGHTFCTSCWQSWFARGNRSCPSCRGKPLNAEPVINRYLSGVIDRLLVRCECGHEFSANHLTTHREEECALRLLDCPLQCGWQGPFASLRDHMPDQCSMMFTVCPREGCGMIVRRADLNKHKPHCRPLPQGEAETGEGQRGIPEAAVLHVPPRVMPDAWKRRLKVGDMVDARDRSHNWFEAVVVEVLPGAVKVHFKGWDSKWDEEISLDAAGDRIEPLYSMAPEWRMGLRSGDLVEVKYENLRWGAGRIAHREGENIRVMDVNDGARLLGVFPISSDMICKMGTHIKNRNQPQPSQQPLPPAPAPGTPQAVSQSQSSLFPPGMAFQPPPHPSSVPLGANPMPHAPSPSYSSSGSVTSGSSHSSGSHSSGEEDEEEDGDEDSSAPSPSSMEAFAPMDNFVAPLMNALLEAEPRPWRMDAARQQPPQQAQETAEVGGQHHGTGANA